MVDTGNKHITLRRAVASARVLMTSETVTALRDTGRRREIRSKQRDSRESWRQSGLRT
jgi:molybdenum cofactor biosynthesis enzyme